MTVKALFCEETFGHSWTDTMQMSSMPSEPSNEPAPGWWKSVAGPKVTAMLSWRMRRPFSTRGRSVGPTLKERIWGTGSMSLGTWSIRTAQARLLADVGIRLVTVFAVALVLWTAGQGGGAVSGEGRGAVRNPWEVWREDPFIQARMKDQFGMVFYAEDDSVVSEWWKELERGYAPETIAGGFT